MDHAAPPHDGNYSFGDKHDDGNWKKKRKKKNRRIGGGGAGGERAPSAAIKMPRRDGRGAAPAPPPPSSIRARGRKASQFIGSAEIKNGDRWGL